IIITATAVTFANHYPGTASQTYDGFDLNVNARPTRRFFLLAGLSIGRTITKNCAVVDNPQTLLFCESGQPFQGTYRVSGGYTFRWNVQVSSVFQSIPPASFQPTDGIRALCADEVQRLASGAAHGDAARSRRATARPDSLWISHGAR